MKGVQCYELFGGIALKIHTFSFSFSMNSGDILLQNISKLFARIYIHIVIETRK